MKDSCDCPKREAGDDAPVFSPISITTTPAGPADLASCQKLKLSPHVRWMLRRDLPEVLRIESASFEFPWQEEDFIKSQRQRNCIGMVAEHCERVIGFMIYELHANRLHILNFAVDPTFRRRGVGAAMIAKLKSKLSPQRRRNLLLEVRETNLRAQLFFKNLGFRAESVLRDWYEDTDEDAYLMAYRCKASDGA